MSRRVPLARLMLSHDKKRLFWSVLGVSFAVFLMFVEMGFMNGAYDSATVLFTRLDADLVMVNRAKENMFPVAPFPRARLAQVKGFPGVADAHPLHMALEVPWKSASGGREHPIRVLGFDLEDPIWRDPAIRDFVHELKAPDTCLIDAESRPYFGKVSAGSVGELRGRRMRIVGATAIGSDLTLDGTVVTSSTNFFRFLGGGHGGGMSRNGVEFGLLQLEPGAEPRVVAEGLSGILLDDVAVMTKQEFVDAVHAYWREHQPVGAVFLLGMIVGFIIGVVICYQILFTEIADHQAQYATLKAIGYRDRFLVATVVRQAVFLALIAFAAGAVGSAVVYTTLERVTGLQMWLTAPRVGGVLALTLAMCLLSALVAIRKVTRSDPAEVF